MFSKKFFAATKEYCTFEKHVNAPYMRKEFDVEKEVETAEITVTSTGFYDIFINGKKITKGMLAPYITNVDESLIYDKYDLKPYLKEGKNCIGFILGNGMVNCLGGFVWELEQCDYRGAPAIAFALDIDGKITEADESIKCAPSPVTFDDMRCGERYDARLEQDGWCNPGFDDTQWSNALPSRTPAGRPSMYIGTPVKQHNALKSSAPIKGKAFEKEQKAAFFRKVDLDKILPIVDGEMTGYIYDFGKNCSGVPKLKINGKKGQKIVMQFSEYVEDGVVDYEEIYIFYPKEYAQRDVYICKGGEEEIYIPSFTFHCGRYCLVTGLEEHQAVPETLEYLEVHADLPRHGGFECSDDVANKLQAAAVNSNLSNLICFPLDCPHREKNGWTGDAAMSAEQFTLNLGMENLFRQWLATIRLAQRDDGAIPGIVPTAGWGYAWGNGPTWDSVMVELPYMTYLYRGNTEILSENADMIFKYLNYLSKRRMANGLIDIGLGDWCQTDRESGNPDCPTLVTDSIMSTYICQRAEYIFDVLGLNAQRDFAKALKNEFRNAVRKYLVDFNTMTVESSTQCGQAMALYCGIFENGEKREAYNRLLDFIHAKDDHFYCGMIGVRMVFHVLAEFGDADLAYKMITRTDYPSYGIMVAQGLTSIPELFLEKYNGHSGSLNHHFMGDFSNFFITKIAGIRVNPHKTDCKNINVAPAFIETLDYAKADYDSVGGKIEVLWKRLKNGKIALCVNKNGDAYGKIILPKGYVFADKSDCADIPVEFKNYEIKNGREYDGIGGKAVTNLETGVYVIENYKNLK